MKTIPLKKGKLLLLPDVWEELTFKQKLKAFYLLREVASNRMDPRIFRIVMLKELTGYKPSYGFGRSIFMFMVFPIRVTFVALWYFLRLGKVRFSAYMSVWLHYNKPKARSRSNINYNLFRLSEMLDFAFDLENGHIKLKKSFTTNPVPYIKVKGHKLTGRKFILGIAPFTNISGKEFYDCFAIYLEHESSEDTAYKEQCANKIISILYPITNDYDENMVGDHISLINHVSPELKFGILLWFSGIVEYYITHPVYSILFTSTHQNEDSDSKISLGMNEIVLMVIQKGYNIDGRMKLNDFLDTQIKILKDNLADAVAKGAKISDIAKQTKLDPDLIKRLI